VSWSSRCLEGENFTVLALGSPDARAIDHRCDAAGSEWLATIRLPLGIALLAYIIWQLV